MDCSSITPSWNPTKRNSTESNPGPRKTQGTWHCRSVPFDNSSASAGTFLPYKSDNSRWQVASTTEIAAIELHPTQFTLSQNPQVDNAGYAGWHSVADDIVENGGMTLWYFQRIDNDNQNPIADKIAIIQCDNLIQERRRKLRPWNTESPARIPRKLRRGGLANNRGGRSSDRERTA